MHETMIFIMLRSLINDIMDNDH